MTPRDVQDALFEHSGEDEEHNESSPDHFDATALIHAPRRSQGPAPAAPVPGQSRTGEVLDDLAHRVADADEAEAEAREAGSERTARPSLITAPAFSQRTTFNPPVVQSSPLLRVPRPRRAADPMRLLHPEQWLADAPTVETVADAAQAARPRMLGKLTELLGLHLVVTGIEAAVGDVVEILPDALPGASKAAGDDLPEERAAVFAEVAASTPRGLVCMPMSETKGLRKGQMVRSTGAPLRIPVGPEMLGRVIDGLGRPIDDLGSLDALPRVSIDNKVPSPLDRDRIDTQVGLGVRALDALVPCGRGQRMAIMAGSGVGKSTLLSMIARGTEATMSVIALVGERGREVREFIENDLGPEGMARSIVVVATSDAPPVERLRAAFTATRIAEHFRDQGQDVVLMMDSLTRVAMAQREIGLSAGEPPATRGYPPSVFSLLPRLLERAGNSDKGSITGLYTVLVEGDDLQDPIGDHVRSILDGHIVLSRRLATSGHFPSIDVLESISRVTNAVTSREQRASATLMRRLMAAHRDVKELVEIGAYAHGSDPDADAAIALQSAFNDFLRQDIEDSTPAAETWDRLAALFDPAQLTAATPAAQSPAALTVPAGAGGAAAPALATSVPVPTRRAA